MTISQPETSNLNANDKPNESTENGLAILNSKASFGSNYGKDSLDVALIFGSFEQHVSLFFQGDGVYQLIDNQDGGLLSIKDYLKTFAAFEFYDIEDIYVCQLSLEQRQLSLDFHINEVQVLSCEEFSAALNYHKHVLRF